VTDVDGEPSPDARRRCGQAPDRSRTPASGRDGGGAGLPVTSTSDVRCTFTSAEGGVYPSRPRRTTAHGRARPRYASGAGGRTVPRRGRAGGVTLVPDRKEYARGDTAEVLVMAPFTPAEGLLTLRRSGIVRTERFTLAGASRTLRIPIEEAWTPNVHVQVDLVGAAPRTNDAGDPDPKLPRRPAFASRARCPAHPAPRPDAEARGHAARDEARARGRDDPRREPARRGGPAGGGRRRGRGRGRRGGPGLDRLSLPRSARRLLPEPADRRGRPAPAGERAPGTAGGCSRRHPRGAGKQVLRIR
jgi:hypothetical protein